MDEKQKAKRQKMIARIWQFTLMDDDFMTRFFDGEEPFGDGSHIVYVNGAYRGNDPIGELMHDFSCNTAGDLKNAVLAELAKYLAGRKSS